MRINNDNSEVDKIIDQKALDTFDKLYNETYQDVLQYVICHCSQIEDVKDIVQNVYIDIFKMIQKNGCFNKDYSYIVGMTKNKIKTYYRYHYKTKMISLFSHQNDDNLLNHVPSEEDIQKEILQQEDIELIWNYLKKKKVIISQVFYLYYYVGMSIKEISIELNVKESNVKNYLYRTLKELNSLMKYEGDKYDK